MTELHCAPVSSQGQKVRVTGRLTQTHKMCHVFQTVMPKNFKVGMRNAEVDGGCRPTSTASAMTSKV